MAGGPFPKAIPHLPSIVPMSSRWQSWSRKRNLAHTGKQRGVAPRDPQLRPSRWLPLTLPSLLLSTWSADMNQPSGSPDQLPRQGLLIHRSGSEVTDLPWAKCLGKEGVAAGGGQPEPGVENSRSSH